MTAPGDGMEAAMAKAVEAAARGIYVRSSVRAGANEAQAFAYWDHEREHIKDGWRGTAKVALQAAAPHIAAQALRDAAKDANWRPGAVKWLRARADALAPPSDRATEEGS